MTRGRKRRPDIEICSRCGDRGYSYTGPAWNSRYKNAPRNMYRRFIHENRSKPYCYINTKLAKGSYSHPLKVGREYNHLTKEVTIFQFQPNTEFPLQQYIETSAFPIIIYDFHRINDQVEIPNFSAVCRQCYGRCTRIHDLRCAICNNTTIVWCAICQKHWDFKETVHANKISRDKNLEMELKKLKRISLKMAELNWLSSNNKIQGEAREFIQKLYKKLKDNSHNKNTIMTYGYKAIDEADRIHKKFSSFIRGITYLSDEYGVLEHLEQRKRSSRK